MSAIGRTISSQSTEPKLPMDQNTMLPSFSSGAMYVRKDTIADISAATATPASTSVSVRTVPVDLEMA